MSKQYLDKKKLETLKSKLNGIKTALYTDFLLPIEDDYKKICSEDVWAGKKSDAFRESFQKYWYSTTEEKVGLSDVIANDFDNMIAFIDEAIKATDKTDTDSAKKMFSSVVSDGIAKAVATVKAGSSNVGGVSGVSGKIDENPDADMSGVNGTAGGVPANSVNSKISYVGNSNIIATSKPVFSGKTYNLSQEDINYLAYVAMKEQTSVEGAKLELSLIVNKYEQNNKGYDNIRDFVENCGWWSKSSTRGYSYPGDEYVAVAEDVLIDGNRYLPSNVNQHYDLSAVRKVVVNGIELNRDSNGNYDTSKFIPYKTKIYETNRISWTFVGFAPDNEWGVQGDPFGYE